VGRVSFFAALLVLLLIAPATSAADPPVFRDAILSPNAARSLQATAEWGGPITATDGETVNIYLSDTFPVDPALQLQWADFMTSLIHGKELQTVSIHLEQPSEIARNCGVNALACYSPGTYSIYAPAVDPAIDVSARGVLIHEYGHHVAESRPNPPFASEDYGTKRWATYENVCARTAAGDLYPGAEDQRFYTLNPGEAFAEAYRVLNEQRLNMPLEAWSIVSTSLEPDATALTLLEQDVTTPWIADAAKPLTARLSSKVRAVKFSVPTPLDGSIVVKSRKSGNTQVNIALLVKNKVQKAKTFTAAASSVSSTVCGARTYTVRARLMGKIEKTTKATVALSVFTP
jgi:hypothetical protein